MFNWVFSIFCTVVIVSCTSAALFITVQKAAYGHTPASSYTLEIPGITCQDIQNWINHGWSDPHHVCHH